MLKDFLPPPDVLIELEPEEIGSYLLLYLVDFAQKNPADRKLHRFNIINPSNSTIREYAGSEQMITHVCNVLWESWEWLRAEGFLAPTDDNNDEWVHLSRRGLKIKTKEDFLKFSHIKLLPKNVLDPKLAEKVWPIFIKGDFDTAIFAAFKEVEVRTREAGGLPETLIGTELMRAAFDAIKGPLADLEHSDKGERESYAHLFAGAIGAFKNPGSHRDVNYDDANVATGLILFANTLLKIVDKRGTKKAEDDIIRAKVQASSF